MRSSYTSWFDDAPIGAIVIGAGAVLIIGGGIGLWAYGEFKEPDAGTITEMEYEPEYWDSGVECLPGANGQVQCLPYNDYYAPSWCVWYEDAEGNEGDACISQQEYESLHVGDHFEK
jgi:hypothetical protein